MYPEYDHLSSWLEMQAHVKERLPVRSRIVRLSPYDHQIMWTVIITHPDLVLWPICAWGRDSS
jgi:hypothetical protein